MSWFSSKTATPARSTIRQQEVGILQRTMRDLNWISPDETCLKMIQVGTSQIQLTLSIHIPQDYPQKPPVLRVLTPAQHQWLDTQGFLTLCPAISNWNPQSPSLVSLIQFIETKFRETPPIPQQTQNFQQNHGYNNNNTPFNPGQSNMNGYQQPQPQQQQQQQQYNNGTYGQSPHLNQSNAYLPPQSAPPTPHNNSNNNINPYQPSRPSQPYDPQQQSQAYNSFTSPPQSPTHSTPAPPPQQLEQPSSSIKYQHQAIPRPSTPQSPPEIPVQLAPIPSEPALDRTAIQRLPMLRLEELDNDAEKIKSQVAQNPTINQMYESLIKAQFEVEELEGNLNKIRPQIDPMKTEVDRLKTSIATKQQHFQHLKPLYESKLSEFDVSTYLTELQTKLSQFDDEGEDLISKFLSIRNPSEDELQAFLSDYERIRHNFHVTLIIAKRLRVNLGGK